MKLAFAGVEALPNLVFWRRVFPQLVDTPKVILASNVILGRSPRKVFKLPRTLLNRSGFSYTAYILSLSLRPQQGLMSSSPRIPELAREHGVEIIGSGNFSHPDTIQALEARGVTHVVSHYCDQIFKPNFLAASFETLNLHPSLLPEYRGVDPLFQQLLDGKDELGVTLHQINAQIDEGPIINQLTFPNPFTSHRDALIQAAEIAAELFIRWFQNPSDTTTRPQSTAPKTPYHSWPTKEQLHRFQQKGLRLA